MRSDHAKEILGNEPIQLENLVVNVGFHSSFMLFFLRNLLLLFFLLSNTLAHFSFDKK